MSLPILDISSGPNYELYGVNVPQFAGMQEDLRFTAPGFTANGPNIWTIDDIQFSPVAVPEPTTPTLVAAGGLVLLFRTFRRRRNSANPAQSAIAKL